MGRARYWIGPKRLITLVLAIAIVAIFIIALVNFGLVVQIWAFVLIGVLLTGTIFTVVRQFWKQRGIHKGGNEMAYCPRCGQLVRWRDVFCSNCGARLDDLERGRGVREVRDRGHWEECPKCHGTFRIPCERCDAKGVILGNWELEPCPICNKTKIQECNYGCTHGQIWVSDR
jgi:hypothetical protein